MDLAGAHQLDRPTVDQVLQNLPKANGGTVVQAMPKKRNGLGQDQVGDDKGTVAVKQLIVCQLRRSMISAHQSPRRHIPRPGISFLS